MRRTALSTFLIVAILGLGCMGVSVPGRATHTCETGGLYEMTGENCYIDYQLKHSIKLGAKCWDFFKHSSELPKTPIRRGGWRTSTLAYVVGTSSKYACGLARSASEAIRRCNTRDTTGAGLAGEAESFPPGTRVKT